jgi:aminoglycoside 6'-N-acetyltransferase
MTPSVSLRPLADADLPAVAQVLRDPTVAVWWGAVGADIRAEFEDPFLVLVDGDLAGVLDVYEEQTPDCRSAALDIVLTERHQDRGIGRTALRQAIDVLSTERGHHRFTIDPAVTNVRAIRCYEAVGFRPVGVMRQYERTDGVWHDNLLMDLLVEDL